MAKSDEPVIIKKYANRRLYNTGTSTYVTLEDLASMVKAGEDFVVYDAKTNEDITRSVLTQIIFEQENKEGGQNLLPINFLRQLIRFYGDSMQMLVPRYLEVSLNSLTKEQAKFREQISQAFGMGGFGAMEDQVRRNMEMFERTFAMFAPFARQGGQSRPGRRGESFGDKAGRRRRHQRDEAADGRDAEASRPARRQGLAAHLPRHSAVSHQSKQSGDGHIARPLEFVPSEETDATDGTPSPACRGRSGVAERQRDEPHGVAGLHPHQHVAVALATCVLQ